MQGQSTTGKCDPRSPVFFTDATVMGVSSVATQRSSSIDLGFADPMCAVHGNIQSGQSLCSPETVCTLLIVQVSSFVSIKTYSACSMRAISAFMVARISASATDDISRTLLAYQHCVLSCIPNYHHFPEALCALALWQFALCELQTVILVSNHNWKPHLYRSASALLSKPKKQLTTSENYEMTCIFEILHATTTQIFK